MITLQVSQVGVDVNKDGETIKHFPFNPWDSPVDSGAYSEAVFFIRHNFFDHATYIDLSQITRQVSIRR